jgi:hypothetical protein
MERLLVLKVDAVDCEAEAFVNGVPLARVDAARPTAVVPVHEYTMAGHNQLQLVIWPRPAATPATPALPAAPRVADGKRWAQLRVLLPRTGSVADESSARGLAQIEWSPPDGEAYDAPLTLVQDFGLPVSFPKWRWLEAPASPVTTELQAQAAELLQGLARDLAAGQPERFIATVRLRTEEVAVAYQRRPEDEAQRLRAHLQALHAESRLVFAPLDPAKLVLRSLADGRLLECLGADGRAALTTQPDPQGRTVSLPLRLTAVDGKLYVLR